VAGLRREERLEHAAARLLVHPRARIGDRKFRTPRNGPRPDGDAPLRAFRQGVFRVRDQVQQHLGQLVLVPPDYARALDVDSPGDALLLPRGAPQPLDVGDKLVDRDDGPVRGPRPRDKEQVPHDVSRP
jgi:hypothetical protein